MREFMTKVSEYWDERRNDPDRQENRLAVVVTGAVAVAIIVLLVVLLWGYAGKGRDNKASGIIEQTGEQAQQTDQDKAEKEALSKEIHEEETVKYMSEDSGEKLRQEYLTSTAYLREKVEELLRTMTQVQDGFAELEEAYKDADAAAQKQITVLRGEVETIVLALKETQVKLTDLTDVVQVIDKEKIPAIQQQLTEIRGDMEQVKTDISGLHEQMKALKKEDEKLWESISKLEKKVKTALNQNVAEVNNRLDQLQAGFDHLKQEFEKLMRENMEDVNQKTDDVNEKVDGANGRIDELGKKVDDTNGRIDELGKRMDSMGEKIDTLISQLGNWDGTLSENVLSYRYEAESNTLYLSPMKERRNGE